MTWRELQDFNAALEELVNRENQPSESTESGVDDP